MNFLNLKVRANKISTCCLSHQIKNVDKASFNHLFLDYLNFKTKATDAFFLCMLCTLCCYCICLVFICLFPPSSTSAVGDIRIEQQVNLPSQNSALSLPPWVTRVSKQWVLCCCLIYCHPSSLCLCTRVDSRDPLPENFTPLSAIWVEESPVWNVVILWPCARGKRQITLERRADSR